MKMSKRILSVVLLVLGIILASQAVAVAGSGQAKLKRPRQESPTPVPEPATMILLGSGIAGLLGLRKRSGIKSVDK